MRRIVPVILLIMLIIPFCAFGGDADPINKGVFSQSIQIEPLSMIASDFSLKYEILFNQKHGFVFDGSLMRSSTMHGSSFGVSYRKHRRGTMGGGFWGVFIRSNDYRNIIKDDDTKYPYTMKSLVFGPNIGKRWIFWERWSIVWRVGYGYPVMDFKWENGRPSDSGKLIEAITKFGEGMDAEISFGFCL